MTKQEWEKQQAEELEKDINGFAEYLLDEGFASHAKMLDLRNTEEVWRKEYNLGVTEASIAWNIANEMRSK